MQKFVFFSTWPIKPPIALNCVFSMKSCFSCSAFFADRRRKDSCRFRDPCARAANLLSIGSRPSHFRFQGLLLPVLWGREGDGGLANVETTGFPLWQRVLGHAHLIHSDYRRGVAKVRVRPCLLLPARTHCPLYSVLSSVISAHAVHRSAFLYLRVHVMRVALNIELCRCKAAFSFESTFHISFCTFHAWRK